MAPQARNRLKVFLRFGLSALALYLVFREIQTEVLWSALQKVHVGWLGVCILLYVASKAASSLRLTRYFDAQGIRLSEVENLRLYWVGMFYNLFLPGGIGGDAYKVWYLHRHYDAPAGKAFQCVLIDRVSGLLVLASLGSLVASLAFPQLPWSIWLLPCAGLLLASLLPVHLLIARAFLPSLAVTTAYSFVVQAIQLACAALLLMALGIREHTGAYLTVFLASSVVSVLPISIGGIGLREIVFITAARFVPIVQEEAVAFSLLFFLVSAISSLPGAWVDPSRRQG